jgi:nucleotide-binding universal stress UspA family protein
MRTTPEKFRTLLSHFGARRPNAQTGVLALREPARVVPHRGSLAERRPPADAGRLVKVQSGEELPAGFCVNLHRILVPTALDDASTTALEYASSLALAFGSELALLHVLEDPAGARASRVETELQRRFAAVRARGLHARLFLRADLVCEQVKAVASALKANLIVTSHDYHRRFLSCLAQEDAGGSAMIQGVPCPLVLVNAAVGPKALGMGVPLGCQRRPLAVTA